MSKFNKIVLVGRVASEVELKYTTEGTAFSKFRIAVDRPKRSDGEQKTDFISIVMWKRLAEISSEYLKKGRLVLVEGRIQVRTYDDSDGERRYVTEVIGQSMRMLESLSKSKEGNNNNDAYPIENHNGNLRDYNPSNDTKNEVKKEDPSQQNEVGSHQKDISSIEDQPQQKEKIVLDMGDQEPFYTEDDIPF